MKYIILFIFLISFSACSDNEVNSEIMSKTYVDLLIVKESLPSGSDTLKSATNDVFKKYNITSESYYTTLKSYEADQKKWDEFFNKSRGYLDSLKSINKSI